MDGISLSGVRVNSLGLVHCAPDWSVNFKDGLVDYDLVVIARGTGVYRHGESSWPVGPGSAMLLRKGERYTGRQNPEDRMSMYFFHFDFINNDGDAISLCESDLPDLHTSAANSSMIIKMAERIHHFHHTARYRSCNVTGNWLLAMLWELWDQKCSTEWRGHEREQVAAVQSICHRIRDDIGRSWRIAEIASQLHCTPDHAGRLFRKYINQSPGDFIIGTRIDVARDMLLNTSRTVTEIAQELGYSDIYGFSKQFKLRTGRSPIRFRQGT